MRPSSQPAPFLPRPLPFRIAARLPYLLWLWLGVAGLLHGGAAHAQVDAFSAEVAVADRGDAERDAAYEIALRQVLLANSGDKTLMNRDDVRAGLRAAAGFVETYRFRTPSPGTQIAGNTPVTETVRRSGEATGLLLVRFDRERVLELVAGDGEDEPDAAAGETGSSDETGRAANARPSDPFEGIDSALVWLLIDEGEREILGTDDAALKVRERLREIAGGAGITLDFPAAGELDADALRSAVRNGDLDAVREASLRYAPQAILVGRISRGDGRDADRTGRGGRDTGRAGRPADGRLPGVTVGWQGEWAKLAGPALEAGLPGGAPASGGASLAGPAPRGAAVGRTVTLAARLDQALQDGLDWLAPGGALAAGAEYAYGGAGADTEGLVRVDALAGTADYADLMALFESVEGVTTVYPKEILERGMVFAVLPRSALPALSTAALASGRLRRTAPLVREGEGGLAALSDLAFELAR